MSVRIKRTVIILMLSLITLPFIMVTDLFPFMRFGMFAEPVRHSIQTEKFQIIVVSKNGLEEILKPEMIGIEDHFYQYLIRNYFYRGEGTVLLQKIKTLLSSDTKRLELERHVSGKPEPDSSILFIPR